VWYCDLVEMSGNPIITFPVKKRTNTGLFFMGNRNFKYTRTDQE